MARGFFIGEEREGMKSYFPEILMPSVFSLVRAC
jgi:hypothetical protein